MQLLIFGYEECFFITLKGTCFFVLLLKVKKWSNYFSLKSFTSIYNRVLELMNWYPYFLHPLAPFLTRAIIKVVFIIYIFFLLLLLTNFYHIFKEFDYFESPTIRKQWTLKYLVTLVLSKYFGLIILTRSVKYRNS